MRSRLPAMARGDASGRQGDHGRAAFHRAAAALFGSLAHQEDGRARHRPAFDLHRDPLGAARSRLCAGRQEAPRAGRQGPRSSPPSSRPSSSAMSSTTSPPISRSSSTGSPTARSTGRQVLRDFWRDFTASVDEIKDLRITNVLDALNDILAPHIFPANARRRRCARLPLLRQWPAVAQARQVRRLRRLLELSRLPLHAPDRDRRRRRARRCRPRAS